MQDEENKKEEEVKREITPELDTTAMLEPSEPQRSTSEPATGAPAPTDLEFEQKKAVSAEPEAMNCRSHG